MMLFNTELCILLGYDDEGKEFYWFIGLKSTFFINLDGYMCLLSMVNHTGPPRALNSSRV